MNRPRFVHRTIKDGSVKIFGKIFKPDKKFLTYDGRLDNLRYAFSLYWDEDFLEDGDYNLDDMIEAIGNLGGDYDEPDLTVES